MKQTPNYRPQGYGRGQTEKPQPVLGQQPPLPRINQPVVVKFAQTKESPWEKIQALLPIVPYVDEGSSSSLAIAETQGYENLQLMHPPQLDVETLLFIAQNNMRPQQTDPMYTKGCFKCGAKDHWHKKCPHDEKQPHFKPVLGFVTIAWSHTYHYTVPKTSLIKANLSKIKENHP